jgi:hypothetical protein
MSQIEPLEFQKRHIDAIVARFDASRHNYDILTNSAELPTLRKLSAGVMLQAPTGVGKTLIAADVVALFSAKEKVVWFWFAPLAALVSQAETTLRVQASQLKILNIENERNPDNLVTGAIFVITWQTVAAKTRESRLARVKSDDGPAVDELIAEARAAGFRIGAVIDEAHHGFVKAKEAYRFFNTVLEPDYALLMTATPRDTDVANFTKETGYQVGQPDEWATITRYEGFKAGLLKQGVKTVRFLTRNEDDNQLVDFEEVALTECAAMHRYIKQVLADIGVSLTPLMLVQVPNGGASIKTAQHYLVDTLKFPESAVRVHVSEDPDPNLLALAHDPTVEVIVFKMAIAMGFDAPRAFTLAALRGTRNAEFGIQVVGRIMRVHKSLQRRAGLPPLLNFGYVYLANSEAQEGLTSAAQSINQMKSKVAEENPETVVTFTTDSAFVQVTKAGTSLKLFPDPGSAQTEASQREGAGDATPWSGLPTPAGQAPLFSGLSIAALARTPDQQSKLVTALTLEAQEGYLYPLLQNAPTKLITEALPATPTDFEQRLVAFVDFSAVIGDRTRSRTQLVKRMTDVFSLDTPEDADIWAAMSPAGIANIARQIAFEFQDVDRRQFLGALKERFRQALTVGGYDLPESEEALTLQMELVLVRNPNLIRQAHKRCRADQIFNQEVVQPKTLMPGTPLEPAVRNIYGVMPADLSPDELRLAELLDTSPDVLWWHRNQPRKPESVGLYRWSSGVGFFPDFVVWVNGRNTGGGVALVEFKGQHLQQYDKEKAGARHAIYGRAFMVGYGGATKKELRLFRLDGADLVDDGLFEVGRLRYE